MVIKDKKWWADYREKNRERIRERDREYSKKPERKAKLKIYYKGFIEKKKNEKNKNLSTN